MKNPKMEFPRIQKRFELSASPDNPDVTVVHLYGFVTDTQYWEDDEVIATKEVREKLLSIKTPEIHLHINSFGGYVFDGIAIYNLLKAHSAKVTAFVDGIAASAASVIVMAADKIVMPANTMLMIHCAHTIAWGNAAQLHKEAEALEKIDAAVRASYQSRFMGTEAELIALLESEAWLTAPEAKALGLCDEVIDETPPPEENPPPDEPPKNAVLRKYGYTNATTTPDPKPQAKLLLSKCLTAFFNGTEKKEEKKK